MLQVLLLSLFIAAPPEPLHIAAPVLDAGEVRVGPPLVRRFAFVNAGTEPLTVTELKASCGCLTPTLPQRTYRPGERGEVALEVNTLSQPAGPNRCGDRTGEVVLELTAKLVREIDITPASLVLSGDAPPPGQVSISFSHPIADPRWKDFLFREVKASSPRLTANASISSDQRGVLP